jgi:hypothetical protein
VICRAPKGSAAAKRLPGQPWVRTVSGAAPQRPAARARPEMDDGQRGQGSLFGACRRATGEACTPPYAGRTMVTGVEFLARVDLWGPQAAEPV